MVMSDAAFFAQAPQHSINTDTNHGKSVLVDKTATTARRPRTREVTSRYKSPTASNSPAPAPIRRFPTPNADRASCVPDVSSPKRAQSAERRRPSPTRTGESRSSNTSLDTAVVPKRPTVRTELLWPSTRSLSSSMQAEHHSLPPHGSSKSHFDSKGKSYSNADQTLRPSANTMQRSGDLRKPMPERKGTPLRCQNTDQVENSRPMENVCKSDLHRWPGSANAKLAGGAMSRSVDLSSDRERPLGRSAALLVQGKTLYGTSRAPRPAGSSSRAFSQSINEGPMMVSNALQRAQADSRARRRDSPVNTSKNSKQGSPHSTSLPHAMDHGHQVVQSSRQAAQAMELAGRSDSPSFADNASDTESVSSGGTTSTCSTRGSTIGNRAVRGTNVPARFWQDATSRSRRLSENSKLRSSMPEPEFSSATAGRANARYKTAMSSEKLIDSNPSSTNVPPSSSPWSIMPNRSISSFFSPQQPLSPLRTSPYRSIPSPARSRGTPPPSLPSLSHRSSSAAVMLTFADTRKGKKGLSQIEEIHLHRILHNRLLQWHFVNARADAAMSAQIFSAEKSLYNVCSRIFDLQTSVTVKRSQLQQERQAYTLISLLSVQAPKLEEWSSVQNEHSHALTGAVQALEAAVLQVPVTGGVKADTLAVKDAICSAFDMMTTLENSVNVILPKAEKAISLVSELAHVIAQERASMAICADMLALASALEVEECSLQTHLLQLEYERARVLGHLLDSAVAPDAVLVASP